MKNLICFLGAFLLMTTSAFSQKKWSLEECVNYAREKNLIIKQADINIESAEVDLKAARWSRLPNLSASSGFNYNFGRNIDPTTNDFVPTNLGYNSWNVSSNMPIYTGGRIETSIAQAQLSMQEANVRKQQTSNDVALDVVIAYLNILFENERLNNNRQQLALAEQNLDRMVKMIEAQAAAPNDRYDLDAQVATNEQNVITSENNVAQALINLKNLLQIDPSEAFDIVRPTINIPSADPTTYTFEEVYSRALQTQPSVAADDLMLQRIEKNIDLAKSSYLPTFGIGVGLSSNYSTLAKTIGSYGTQYVNQTVLINDMPVTVQFPTTVPEGVVNTPYFDQINQNLGLGAGVQLNIPIFSRGQKTADVRQAELQLENTRLNIEHNRNNLKVTVQNAVADAKAAQKAYLASQKTLNALQVAYDNTNRRYELGAANNYELLEAKNRLEQGTNNFSIAKFDYLFKLKVVDYYLGKPLKLD